MHFILRLLLLITLMFSGPAVAQTASGSSTSTPEPEYRKLDAIAAYVQGRISDEVFELHGVARTVGSEPLAALSFVRENTVFRPYWGALKGADGVLLDRTGNTLDLSLLVAALVEENGGQVRIGFANVDDVGAERVLAETRVRVPALPETMPIDAELLSAFLNEGGLTREEMTKIAASIPEAAAKARADAIAESAVFAASVKSGLGDAARFLSPLDRSAQQAAMAREYFWAEYLDSGGVWHVLEPLPLGLAEKYRTGATYFDADAVPDPLVNDVRLGGALEMSDGTDISLAHLTFTSSEAVLVPFSLSNTPVLDTPPTSISEAVGISSEPPEVLTFRIGAGAVEVISVQYRMDGTVLSDGPLRDRASEGLGGIGSSLGDLGQVTPKPDAASGGALRLNITYTLRNSRGMQTPHDVVVLSRTVVAQPDIPGALGHGAGFNAPWHGHVTVIPFAVEPGYLDHRALQSDLTLVRSLTAFGAGEGLPEDAISSQMEFHASVAHQVAMFAREMSRDAETGNAAYADQMAVVVEEARFVDGGDAGDMPVIVNGIDLVQITSASTEPSEATNGLAWTLAEKFVLDKATAAGSRFGFATDFPTLIGSAGLTIAEVSDLGATRRYQEPLATSLAGDIAAAREPLVLSHNGTGLFLSRDPYTGMLIGRTPDGRGSEFGEAGKLNTWEYRAFETWRNFATTAEKFAHLTELIWCAKEKFDADTDIEFELLRCLIATAINWGTMGSTNATIIGSGILLADCLYFDPHKRASCIFGAVLGAGGAKAAARYSDRTVGAYRTAIVAQWVSATGKLLLAKPSGAGARLAAEEKAREEDAAAKAEYEETD